MGKHAIHPRNVAAVLAALIAASIFAAFPAEPPGPVNPPATGTVSITVRGPDGRPVPHTKIIVEKTEAYHPPTADSLRATTTTDGDGVARFDWPQGVAQASITVPGIGYGVTGLFETAPDQPAEADLPPLVAMSRVEGSVKSGETVTVSIRSGDPVDVAVDPAGHFSFEGESGWWNLLVQDNGKPVRKAGIDVGYGETIRDPKFESAVVDQEQPVTPATDPDQPEPDQPATWVTGVVRDLAGKPVAGATVCVAATLTYAEGPEETIESATTDANGRYVIRGNAKIWNATAAIMVCKPGGPYAIGYFSFNRYTLLESDDRHLAPAPTAVRDFVLSDRSGDIDVALKSGGKPMPGLSVVLLPTDELIRSHWDNRKPDENPNAFTDRVFPRAVSDQNGRIHFGELPPGRYDVVATDGDVTEWHNLALAIEPKKPGKLWGSTDGVCVVPGQTAAVDLNVYEHQWSVAAQFAGAAGKPVPPHCLYLTAGKQWEQPCLNYGFDFNGQGIGKLFVGSSGLWNVQMTYSQFSSAYRVPPEPCYAVESIVGVSSLLHVRQPPTLAAVWQEPGSVDVDLLDIDGKPAKGVVTLFNGPGPIMVGTAVDGHIQFKRIQSSTKWYARGELAGKKLPFLLGDGSGNLPNDQELRGRQFVPDSDAITVTPLSHQRVVLKEVPAGYVRGHLHREKLSPERRWVLQCRATDPKDRNGSNAEVAYGNNLSDFVDGPYAAGEINLDVCSWWVSYNRLRFEQLVQIKPGEVTSVDLNPTDEWPLASHVDLLGIDDKRTAPDGSQLVPGRVFLSDGKTPAWGARLYFSYGDEECSEQALTDAAGRIQGDKYWYFPYWPTQPTPPGSPTGPVVVAVLPGAAGGTVVDCATAPAAPMSIVLPPPVSVHGRLTVAGKPPANLNGKLQIYAAYQGRGKLNDVLSVAATPSQDGTFYLPGLTPGNYLVQASLDGIWLSESKPLTVAAEDLPPIALDIPEPAGPVAVSVVDKHGRPAINQAVTVDRPAGPLTDRYWPRDFTTDGAGVAHIPALEAGRHRVHAGAAEIEVTPPSPVCDAPAQFTITVGD